MTGNATKISQKEYLKKYLSGGNDDKKKKKKKKVKTSELSLRTKIIDDDVDLSKLQPLDESALDLYETNEDAPVVAGIVDERPIEVQALDQYKLTQRWKVLSNPDGEGISVSSMSETQKASPENDSIQVLGRHIDKEYRPHTNKSNIKDALSVDRKFEDDSDIVPPRKKYSAGVDSSPPRRKSSNVTDLSPPRKKKVSDYDLSPRRRRQSCDMDASPPRRKSSKVIDCSPPQKKRAFKADISPPRRKHSYDSDASPPRRRSSNVKDLSPPRRKQAHDSNVSPPRKRSVGDIDASPPRRKSSNIEDFSPRRKHSGDVDNSPKRNSSHTEDLSPPRRKQAYNSDVPPPRQKNMQDFDSSPPRRRQNNEVDTFSLKARGSSFDRSLSKKQRQSHDDPSRKERNNRNLCEVPRRIPDKRHRSSDLSPPRHSDTLLSPSQIKQEDESPPSYTSHAHRYSEKNTISSKEKGYKDSPPSSFSSYKRKVGVGEEMRDGEKSSKKMDKTLDGKVAGLQDASKLKDELEQVRRREDEAFSKMDSSVSGRGAAAVQRDRKTGMKRNLELERAEHQAKEEVENIKKEKYDRWGKGVKQTEEQKARLARDLHEMSKPLARYADDEDLESYLRHQDREGDPMLEYLRSKKKGDSSSHEEKPLYQGSFPPNRYNIRPGYRWDGRDRSNGYEQKLFENINARKAVEEEAYKWSTSDM